MLAELNDFLTALAPFELLQAVGDADLSGLTPFAGNYVAAMVDEGIGEALGALTRRGSH